MNARNISLIGAALVLGSSQAQAGSVVTAEWAADTIAGAYGSFGGAGASEVRGQTFQATEPGRVASIALRVGRSTDHDEPLLVELHALDAGRPAGAALMSQVFPAEMMPVGFVGTTPPVFAFDAGAELVAGESYAITFRPVTLDPETNVYFANGGVNDDATYADGTALRSADGGATWIVESIIDWGFRVQVDGATPIERGSWGTLKNRYR
jgi:hypothetical protein